jgi:hypothetical protein
MGIYFAPSERPVFVLQSITGAAVNIFSAITRSDIPSSLQRLRIGFAHPEGLFSGVLRTIFLTYPVFQHRIDHPPALFQGVS